MANKKVRVLVATVIGGVSYQPNDVVNLADNLVKAHADTVDANKEAVAYALSINGNTVREHKDPAAEQRAALQAELSQLEADLAAAADDAKPAIQQAIEAKQQALAALG